MKKIYTILGLLGIAVSMPNNANAQLVGGSAYMKGDYVEVAISHKGNEGTVAIPGDTTYHFRGGADAVPWGFCANPNMDGWVDYNGDFFTPGTPECGIGITYTIDTVTYNKGNNYDIFEIPGEITSYTETTDSVVVIWTGMVDSLEIKLTYELEKSELKYTTTVSLTNIGLNTFTDVYYYDNVDPDNNQSIAFSFTTFNELISQSGMADDSVIVRASQEDPWMSEVIYAAYGPDWKGAIGGFSNRSGYEIWNGTGSMNTTEGYENTSDEAIALAHKTESIAPGKSGATEFSYATAFKRSAINGEPGGGTGVGIDDQHTVDFAIYPNPVQGNEFTLQIVGAFSYTIFDASGKIILTDAGNGTTAIDVKSLEKGIYFIKIDQEGASSTEKLMLK
jgi:hypothetical protein